NLISRRLAIRAKASRRNARAENLSDGLVSTALALPDASGTTYRNSPPRRTIGQTRAKRLGWIRILAGGKAATSAKKLQKIKSPTPAGWSKRAMGKELFCQPAMLSLVREPVSWQF